MLLNLFVKLIFCFVKEYFSLLELFLEFSDNGLFVTDFIEEVFNFILYLFFVMLKL